jgi:hypothetical protein
MTGNLVMSHHRESPDDRTRFVIADGHRFDRAGSLLNCVRSIRHAAVAAETHREFRANGIESPGAGALGMAMA